MTGTVPWLSPKDEEYCVGIANELTETYRPEDGPFRLWAAVLEDAIHLVSVHEYSRNGRTRAIVAEALRWLETPGEALQAFEVGWVCQHLGLDLSAVRDRVQAIRRGIVVPPTKQEFRGAKLMRVA